MEEKSKVIFGNVMSDKVYKSAVKSKSLSRSLEMTPM